jgi:hypothetical protein
MPKITIIYAAILILLGVGAYVLSGGASVTALIPSFFGAIFLVLGLLALKESLLKHAMHGASVLALLAMGGTVGGFFKVFTLITGGDVARPQAVVVQAIMFVLTTAFLALCIRSFIEARRRRLAGG